MNTAEALDRIYKRDGALTAESVVREARKKSSPLHAHFTWDDTEAAIKWREQQARVLIARFKIEVETQPDITKRVRRFTHLREIGYVGTADALADPTMRDLVFEQAVREVQAFRRKYEALVDVEKVWATAAPAPDSLAA